METKTIEGIFIDRELVEEGAHRWSLWCQRAPDLYSVIMKTILYKVFSMYKPLPKLHKKYEEEVLHIDILVESEFLIQILWS